MRLFQAKLLLRAAYSDFVRDEIYAAGPDYNMNTLILVVSVIQWVWWVFSRGFPHKAWKNQNLSIFGWKYVLFLWKL